MSASGPLRIVQKSTVHSGRGSVLGGDTFRRTRWYELELECGHRVDRTVKYKPSGHRRGGSGAMRPMSLVLPPPTRVHCEICEES